MTKLRLAAVAALLLAGFLGAFDRPVQASPYDPWCMEDYWACVSSGQDIADCMCYRDLCMGRDCQ